MMALFCRAYYVKLITMKKLLLFCLIALSVAAAGCRGDFNSKDEEISAGKGEPESSLPDSVRDPKLNSSSGSDN